MYKIQNCTVTFKLLPGNDRFTDDQFLEIARNGWNTEYNPRRFHGIVMRVRHHQQRRTVASLVFRSGRVVMTGVARPDRAALEAELAARRLQIAIDHECQLGVHQLRVVNIVGSCTMTYKLRLTKLILPPEKFDNVRYDPTIFPALRCKIIGSPSATCLLYHSGKVIVTGVRTEEQLQLAFTTLLQYLQV